MINIRPKLRQDPNQFSLGFKVTALKFGSKSTVVRFGAPADLHLRIFLGSAIAKYSSKGL